MKYLIFIILINFFKFNVLASEFTVLEKKLENIELIDKNLKKNNRFKLFIRCYKDKKC